MVSGILWEMWRFEGFQGVGFGVFSCFEWGRDGLGFRLFRDQLGFKRFPTTWTSLVPLLP